MSKRVSSRDDLFLSAVDLYTLLSMVFIGVAFMASSGVGGQALLDLPVVPPSTAQQPALEPLQRPTLFWAQSGDIQAGPNDECKATYTTPSGPPTSKPRMMTVPCWPTTFGGIPTTQDPAWEILRAQSGAVEIRCPMSNTLEACARLQWIAAEHGFKTVIAVRSP